MSEQSIGQILNTTDLLSSKFARPRLRSSLIQRNSLFAKLESSLEYKLVLLCAPAGFGKTTLINTWAAQQDKEDTRNPLMTWLSLDEGDNDPVRFWRYLLTASQRFGATVGQTALHSLQNMPTIRRESVLTSFINDLSTLTVHHVIVLDDYHVIEAPMIHETMSFILDHLPTTTHIILITRSEPALPLARLKASHELLELGAGDLRFTLEETQRFLQQALPYSLPLQLISHVHSRAEGWAVGLHLLSLALQGQLEEQQREHIVTTFTGNYRPIGEYLVSDVLNRQPEPIQDFLLRISILNQLTGSLANAVTGSTQGRQILEQLQKANLFLVGLDEAGEWYRFHSLFTEAMRHEAARRFGLEELRALYERACDWYEAHNMLSEAVESALNAVALARATGLIERVIENGSFTRNRELYTLRRWLEQLPEELIDDHPTLCFALARVLLYTRAPHTLPDPAKIEGLLQTAEDSWGMENNHVRLGESLTFRSVFALLRGDHAHIASDAKQALQSLPLDDIVWRSINLNLIATEELREGQLHVARQSALESLSLWQGTRANDAIQATTLLLVDIDIAQGELHQARALCQQVLTDAEKEAIDPPKPLFKAKALARLASILYEWEELDQAEKQTRQAIALSQQLGDETLQVEALLLLAHILHAQGRPQTAQQVLADLIAQIPLSVSWLFLREILRCQAQLQLSTGQYTAVQDWLTTRDNYVLRLPALHQEQEDILLARLLVIQGRAEDALSMLNSLRAAAHDAGRVRSTLEIQMVMTLAHIARHDLEAAQQTLAGLLECAQQAGYRHLYLDEGGVIAPTLQALLRRKPEQPRTAAFIESLLSANTLKSNSNVSRHDEKPTVSAPLSEQEARIFSLFVNGLSKKEIAYQLHISVNTVKTHLQRVYQKLGVTSRAEARQMSHRRTPLA